MGGPEDAERGREIISQTQNGLNACGELSLTQSALLVKGAEFVVSHDTGMMHISAALKKRYILFGAIRLHLLAWCLICQTQNQ